MALTGGQQVGPYEIVAAIGAGGMGVVYRARDSRLGRDVAIKVLPDGFGGDASRLSRFELEARAASALNHPNIVAVHDVGTHEGAPYLVMELLDGQTLRERLNAGPISSRKATEYAVQVAQGLAAAHDKGIVHRDLKPENVFLTRDGRVKILDFGLAKPVSESAVGAGAGTLAQSQSGAVLGTAGYMSPEQVQGKPADARSDLFSFGVVLYEMLSGRRAFGGPTPVERGYAILNAEPPDLVDSGVAVPVAVDRIVRRCLEKAPEARFQSAQDLGFALSALADTSSGKSAPLAPRRRWWPVGIAAVVFGFGLAVGTQVVRPAPSVATALPRVEARLTFTRVSFREGRISYGRFGPDGQTLYYSASFAGEPWQTWATAIGKPEARPVGPPMNLLADVSKDGDFLFAPADLANQTLILMAANGVSPTNLAPNVIDACFGPDGHTLAVIRREGNLRRLEYPAGVALLETEEHINAPAVAPAGGDIAVRTWRRGISLVSSKGVRRQLSGPWARVGPPTWASGGQEVWFSANATQGGQTSIWAVSLDGGTREVWSGPGRFILLDRAKDGRALLMLRDERTRLMVSRRGATSERNLSWFDGSRISDLSEDGQQLLIAEDGDAFRLAGPGEGEGTRSLLYDLDGGATVQLADFRLTCLAPKADWAAGPRHDVADGGVGLTLVPTRPGVMRDLARGTIERFGGCIWARDGKQLVVIGSEHGRGLRLWAQSIEDGGLPFPVSGEGVATVSDQTSPDGKWVIATYADGGTSMVSTDGTSNRPLGKFPFGDQILEWDADGGAVFVLRSSRGSMAGPIEVYRYDLASGKQLPWGSIAPDPIGTDPTGSVSEMLGSRDGTVAYSYMRILDTLYVVDGLQ